MGLIIPEKKVIDKKCMNGIVIILERVPIYEGRVSEVQTIFPSFYFTFCSSYSRFHVANTNFYED